MLRPNNIVNITFFIIKNNEFEENVTEDDLSIDLAMLANST